MRIKLTSKEIAENHGVSERTAFRWLADNDPRCFTEIREETAEEIDRREGDKMLRGIIDRIADGSNRFGEWSKFYDDSPRVPKLEPLRKQLFELVDKIQATSGLYPEIDWNETASDEPQG
jgi:hypothetical protein